MIPRSGGFFAVIGFAFPPALGNFSDDISAKRQLH